MGKRDTDRRSTEVRPAPFRAILAARRGITDNPDVLREARLEVIRKRIERDAYSVDSTRVAGSLLDESLRGPLS